MKEKSQRGKMRPETSVVTKQTDSDSDPEDETLSRSVSVQSTSSSSCSSSSSDSEFELLQMQSQGPLQFMVEHLRSERSDDGRSLAVEKAVKAAVATRDSRSFVDSDSDSDDVEESHPHSQEVPSPVRKLNTKNVKMLERKSPDSCKREDVLKGDKVYTEELVDLHRRLMALRERNILQQIVNLVEKTGRFNLTKTTFDFDLFSLDEPTVRKLQSYLQTKRT